MTIQAPFLQGRVWTPVKGDMAREEPEASAKSSLYISPMACCLTASALDILSLGLWKKASQLFCLHVH